MENRSYSAVLGSSHQAPALAAYARACGLATNYHAIAHPSLPNYIAAVAGSTFGIRTDCAPSACPVRHSSLFAQVTRAGHRWTGYAQNMSMNCDHASYDSYAARHNPPVYFPSIARDCRHLDVPFGGTSGAFARALAQRRLPAFSFVVPNLCNDGHDCPTGTADTWLGRWLDRITTSPAYAAGRTAVFVTWDEGVGSDNRVATVVIAPSVKPGTRSAIRFTHYSLLRTTEELLGLGLLRNAAHAHSMRSAFRL